MIIDYDDFNDYHYGGHDCGFAGLTTGVKG